MQFRWGVLFVFVGLMALSLTAAARQSTAPAGSGTPTFHKDVLPILQKNCQSCHRPGQIGPMALLDYQGVRPWARAMKNAVVSKKMPPWFAEEPNDHFADVRRLSQQDIDTLARWADTGAAEGNPKDAPPPVAWQPDGWNMGTPDLVVDIGTDFKVPMNGVVEYTYFVVPTTFEKDTWVSGLEIRPTDRSVVHHTVVWTKPKGSNYLSEAKAGVGFVPQRSGFEQFEGRQRNRPDQNDVGQLGIPVGMSNEMFATYFPGAVPYMAAPGQARLIPAGATLIIQMHYTPNGKREVIDRTRVGFKFAKERPRERVFHTFIGNNSLRIPAGAPNHKVEANVTLQAEVKVASLEPHLHLRGKAVHLEATLPTGEKKVLINVPRYDFNWQMSYFFKEPMVLPKGTTLHLTTLFDNSTANRYNPNPKEEVFWGDQSWEEMASSFLDIAYPVDADPSLIVPQRRGPQPTSSN